MPPAAPRLPGEPSPCRERPDFGVAQAGASPARPPRAGGGRSLAQRSFLGQLGSPPHPSSLQFSPRPASPSTRISPALGAANPQSRRGALSPPHSRAGGCRARRGGGVSEPSVGHGHALARTAKTPGIPLHRAPAPTPASPQPRGHPAQAKPHGSPLLTPPSPPHSAAPRAAGGAAGRYRGELKGSEGLQHPRAQLHGTHQHAAPLPTGNSPPPPRPPRAQPCCQSPQSTAKLQLVAN